jgi:hypothetical protein
VTVALAVSVSVVGLGMLALAAGFGANAVRRTRAWESISAPDAYAAPRTAGPPPRPPLESARGMWAGAGISAGLGVGALISAAVVLISTLSAPTRSLSTPATAGGLRRDDSAGTQRLTQRQRQRLREAGMPHPLTAVYRRHGDASVTVLFIGSSGHLDAPADRLREFIGGVAESAGSPGRRPMPYPAGRLNGTVLCLDQLMSGEATLATCGWADDSTLGVITTDGGDAPRTAGLLLSMRDDMERRR